MKDRITDSQVANMEKQVWELSKADPNFFMTSVTEKGCKGIMRAAVESSSHIGVISKETYGPALRLVKKQPVPRMSEPFSNTLESVDKKSGRIYLPFEVKGNPVQIAYQYFPYFRGFLLPVQIEHLENYWVTPASIDSYKRTILPVQARDLKRVFVSGYDDFVFVSAKQELPSECEVIQVRAAIHQAINQQMQIQSNPALCIPNLNK